MAGDELGEASELGRVCALAAECARDLRRCAELYGGLFPRAAFDPDLYHALCLTSAFSSPWSAAERLRVANRAALWVRAVGWQVDHAATTREEVEELAGDCLAVADGAGPRGPATRFLADLCDELATVKEFEELRGAWREQLERMLAAMGRVWAWREAGAVPSLERYVENADSHGSSFVDLSHWIYADPWARGHLGVLGPVSRQVQRYLHLLGDLASYRRDVSWGALNVLMLDVSHGDVTDRMTVLAGQAAGLIGPLREVSPLTAAYLRRQIGFSTGFHGISGLLA
ncbi:terpene synthase family protein [Nonomuraea typhae]|uniref:terpene synthase family protein n=1 Tax=Nonomuraea typhae TaxID=2603600 RepID=UPI0012FC7250|nr:terpene synthase family protein [Nonomuraea typhae]